MQFCLLGLAQAVVHGSEHGLAGQGRAGNSIHAVGGTSLGQGICQGLGSSAAQLRGLTGSVDGHIGHLAAGDGDGDGHLAQAALLTGGVGAVGQRSRAVGSGHGAGALDVQAQHHCHDDSDDGHDDDVAGHCLFHKKSDAPFDLTG